VQGLPALTVPAGFKKSVLGSHPDPKAPPTKAAAGGRAGDDDAASPRLCRGRCRRDLPAGRDFLGRPFSEPHVCEDRGFAEGTHS